MELLGVLIGTRAIKFVEEQIGIVISEKYLWCDSKPVLFWIKTGKIDEKFVENRVREIKKNTGLKIGYIQTEDNSADLGTRGCTPEDLRNSTKWWNGPGWIKEPPEYWPNELNFVNEPDLIDEDKPSETVLLTEVKDRDEFIEFSHWNNWHKLVLCISLVIKFTKIWMSKCNFKNSGELLELFDTKLIIRPQETKRTEKFIYKLAQLSWKQEIDKNLQLEKDSDGVWHVRTRIGNCDVYGDFSHPIWLPKGSPLVKILIRKEHEDLMHSGVDTTLANFLGKFWSPCARRETKKVIKDCKKCQKMEGPKFALPEMPELPSERVKRSRSFEFIGVDYLGPSICKINVEKMKFWIVIFTCLATRAVHLEISLDLSASSFLHIFRRFIALRGCPKKILSDNGTQFKAVADILGATIKGKWNEKSIRKDEFRLNKFLLNKGIDWKFIPALSPWQGGVYERLVKLVKDAFKRSLGSSILNLEELKTFIKEVENAINCRPITHVSTETDGILAIRPIDFLIPELEINSYSLEDSDSEEFLIGKISTAKQLQDRWKATQKAFDKFWNNWVKYYLIILRDRSGWNHQKGKSVINRQPQVGEIVIIQQEGQPRNTWPLGKIIELDGNPARSAKIQLGKKTWIRPINKLFPLEAEFEKIELNKDNNLEEEKQEKTEIKKKVQTHPMITRSKAVALTIIQLIGLFTFGFCVRDNPSRNCRDCKLICTEFGVMAQANPWIRKIEICCMQSCLVNSEGTRSLHFQLAKERTAYNYSCISNYWERDRRYFDRINCPPINPCKRVSGIRERIINIHCESTEALVIFGIGIGFLLSIFISICMFICKIAFILGKLFAIIWWILKSIFNLFKRKPIKKDDTKKSFLPHSGRDFKNNNRKRNRRLHRLGLLAIIYYLVPLIKADIEVVSVQAKAEDCFRKSGNSFCKISTVNTITLLPDGQTASFTIKNNNGIIIGELEFIMKGLSITCNQEVLSYLRSYETKIESVKRCPTEGTCKAQKCGNIKTNEVVQELEEWSKNPGNAFCMEGQALWGYKCGLPGTTCYFYQIFAVPKSNEVYELVTCPTWDYVIEVEMALIFNGHKEKTKFSLYPGVTVHWKDLKITLWDLTPPLAPILNSQFIVGNSGVALVENFKSFLDCGKEARNFSNCKLDTSVCKECWEDSELERVSCSCSDLSIEEIMKDPQKSLPLDIKRIKLRNNGRKILSETHYLPIQVMVRIQNWTIASNVDITKCRVNPIKLSGCYNCRGAIFRFNCISDMGDILAEIKCKGNIFTGHCSKRGVEQYVVLSFDRADIDENCEVICPAGITRFSMRGKLEFFLAERIKVVVKNGTPSIYTNKGDGSKWIIDLLGNLKLIDFNEIIWQIINWKIIFIIFLSFILLYSLIRLFIKLSPIFLGYKKVSTFLALFLFFGLGGCVCTQEREKRLHNLEGQSILLMNNHSYKNLVFKGKETIPFYSLSTFSIKIIKIMPNIAFSKFCSKILGCDEDQVGIMLYSSTEARLKISRAITQVEGENQGLGAWIGAPTDKGMTTPISGVGEWILVRDMPVDSIKPINIEPPWFAAYSAYTKESINSPVFQEQVDLLTGPGILLDHPWRDFEEFYPLSCLVIEKDEEIQGNVLTTDELKEQEIKIKMDVNSGTGKEVEPEINECSTGKTLSVADFHVRIEIKKNLLVGMLMFCLFGVLMAAPGKYSPLSTLPEDQWDSLLDEIEAFEPQMVFENIGIQPTNLSNPQIQVENVGEENFSQNIQEGPRTPPENNQEEREAKRAKLESLFESWLANRPTTGSNVCSTSALGGQTTHISGPSSTSTNTFIPSATSAIGTTSTIQFASTPSLTTPRPLASYKIPKIRKEEIGGSPNCYNKRPHTNYVKSCFLCGNKQHLAKNCPLANCGQQNNEIAPSHQNNSIPPNAAENLARDLTELAQRHPAPLATLLFQLARVLLLTTQAARQQ
uniref:Uncharacterized protein n=1 Tax=Meloidogyne enterolobii TaxID=390850 RepID=A0A6V7V242_MELEN|nr:unnamed protein product [Meloidogyne enterolobii]